MSDLIRGLGRFASVGVIATLVHVSVAFGLGVGLGWTSMSANSGGFLTAVFVSYWGHLRFSFLKPNSKRSYVWRFVVLSLSSYAFSSLIVFVMTHVFEASLGLALVLVAICVPVLSYILSRFWVFSDG